MVSDEENQDKEWEGYMGVEDYKPPSSEVINQSGGKFMKRIYDIVSTSKSDLSLFVEDPTTYLWKLIKKGNNAQSFEILEKIMMRLDFDEDLKNNKKDLNPNNDFNNELAELENKELVQILVYMVCS